jgi:hypothetical protein
MLDLASAVPVRSESRGIHWHVLRAALRDPPILENHVPVFIFARNRVVQLYPQTLGFIHRIADGPRHITPARVPQKHRFQQLVYCLCCGYHVTAFGPFASGLRVLRAVS